MTVKRFVDGITVHDCDEIYGRGNSAWTTGKRCMEGVTVHDC